MSRLGEPRHVPPRRPAPPVRGLLIAALLVAVACGGGTKSESGAEASYDVDLLGVPKFVGSLYLDLSQRRPDGSPLVNEVTRFRSSQGHDYSDSYETCRSMKHYFKGADGATEVYAPVTGKVAWHDVGPGTAAPDRINVAADAQPAFVFTVMHVALDRAYRVGEQLTGGQRIGLHVGSWTWSDIVVLVNDGKGVPKTTGSGPSGRLVSYFETLTDAAFQPFQARGIGSRTDLIISRAARDAAPPVCVAEQFGAGWVDPLPGSVTF